MAKTRWYGGITRADYFVHYYAKNADKYKERSRKTRLENPQKTAEYQREYFVLNRDRLKEYKKAYYQANKIRGPKCQSD